MVEFGRQVARVGEGVAAAADQGLAGVAEQQTSLAADGLDIAFGREQQLAAGTVFKDGFPTAQPKARRDMPEGLRWDRARAGKTCRTWCQTSALDSYEDCCILQHFLGVQAPLDRA